MDPTLEAGFRQPAPVKTTLVRIEFIDGTMLLTDGGFALFNSELYLPKQTPFGVLDSVGEITEGGAVSTTRLEVRLKPEDDTAVAALANPLNQGGLVQWWEAVVDPATNGLIGEPKLKFQGSYDKAHFTVGESRSLMIECGTEAELQLLANSDWRLNDSTHQRAWPGELGLRHVTNLPKQIYWRMEAPRGAITSPQPRQGGVNDGTGRPTLPNVN